MNARNWVMVLGGLTLTALVILVMVWFSQQGGQETPPLPTRIVVGTAAPASGSAVSAPTDTQPAPEIAEAEAIPGTVAPSPLPATATATATPAPPVQETSLNLPQQAIPNRAVVNFNPDAAESDISAYIEQVEAVGGTVTYIEGIKSLIVDLPQGAENLPKTDDLASSEPDYYVVAQRPAAQAGGDPLMGEQWALPMMGIPAAWEALPSNPARVVVAVVDSGICADHIELAGRVLPGWDFVENDDTPQDEFGHGCAVAGIIAANRNNGDGIAGIAPNADILPLRVLNAQGVGRYSDLASAIVYGVDNGAAIINLSLGGLNRSSLLENAVLYARQKGVLVIAAAGNTGTLGALYPAAYESAIAVGAVNQDGQPSSFSNYGPDIDLWAPGSGIRTLGLGNTYVTVSGTSFAAPQVAGVAALEIASGRGLTVSGGLVFAGAPLSATPTPVEVADNPADTPSPTPTAPPDVESGIVQARMANPAAVYCINLGYEYAVGDDGVGVCTFPDGQSCPEWDFLEGTCGQTFSFCAQQGYGIETVTEPGNGLSPSFAVCIGQDGERIDAVTNLANLAQESEAAGCGLPESYEVPSPLEANQVEEQRSTIEDALISSLQAPSAFDWRNYRGENWLTAIRNQGQCGSCWAFGAIASVEGAYVIANNNPALSATLNLSEQVLVSGCSGAGTCCGGWHSSALIYINNGGVPDEACLPYTDGDWTNGCSCNGVCGTNCTVRTGGQCSDSACSARCGDWQARAVQIDGTGQATTAEAIKQHIMTDGPVAVAMGIETAGAGFDANGVYRCTNDILINHAIALVGWNDAGGYWIARNSWGNWNGDGYFHLGYGECGVNQYAYFARITQTPPGVPLPTSPENNGGFVTSAANFSWGAGSGAYDYNIQIATNSSFTTLVRDVADISTTTYSTSLPDGVYYWRVRSVKYNGFPGQWSSSRTFSVNSSLPTTPALTSPVNGSTVTTNLPIFRWTAGNSDRYEIQIGTNNPPTTSYFSSGTSFTPPALVVGQTYFWRVRANNSAGATSSWSDIYGLVVMSPSNATTVPNYFTLSQPTITWTALTWATAYEVQVDNNSTFSSPEFSSGALEGNATLSVMTSALPNGVYYWRVRGRRADGGWGSWSASSLFTIAVPTG